MWELVERHSSKQEKRSSHRHQDAQFNKKHLSILPFTVDLLCYFVKILLRSFAVRSKHTTFHIASAIVLLLLQFELLIVLLIKGKAWLSFIFTQFKRVMGKFPEACCWPIKRLPTGFVLSQSQRGDKLQPQAVSFSWLGKTCTDLSHNPCWRCGENTEILNPEIIWQGFFSWKLF